MRVEGFRASLGVRGIQFSVDGTLSTFKGLLEHPKPEGDDARDPSVNVRTRRDIHALRSDIAMLKDVSVGAVLRSVVLNTVFLVGAVRSPGESPIAIIECEESAA